LLFHETLLAKAPAQFGVAPDVRYQFFSIVGLAASGAESQPLLPHQPLDPKTCDTAPAAGLSYQALSVITDALRWKVTSDIAIYNAGGIRSEINKGAIKLGDVYTLLPFDNFVVTLSLTGAQIHDLFAGARFQDFSANRAAGHTLDDWDDAFERRVREISERPPCPGAGSSLRNGADRAS